MKKLLLFVSCMMFMQLIFAQELNSNRDGSCPSPENFEGSCFYEEAEFGVRLSWDRPEYSSDLVKFEIFRSADGINFEMIKRIVNVPYMSHYEAMDFLEETGTYFYRAVAHYNDSCESEPAEIEMIVAGVDENIESDVAVYPNPTSGKITVKGTYVKKIEVINLMGQTVLTQNVDNDETLLDLCVFGSGVYFINIMSENENIVKKINVK